MTGAWQEHTCERTGAVVHISADARAVVTEPSQLVQLDDMLRFGLTSSPGPGWEWDASQWRWVRWAPWGGVDRPAHPSGGQPAGVDLDAARRAWNAAGSPGETCVDADSSPLISAFDQVDVRALESSQTHQDAPGCEIDRPWDPGLWKLQTPQEWAAAAFADLVWDLAAAQRAWIAGPGAGYLEQGSAISHDVNLTRGPIKDCLEGRWIVFQCEEGHKMVQWTGCTRLDCTHCKTAVGVQRSNRIWADAGDLAPTWGVAVLTVPPLMRHAVTLDKRSPLRRAAWETVEQWLIGEGVLGDVGGVVWFHPVGSAYLCPRAHHANNMGQPLDDIDPCRSVRHKVHGDGQHVKKCEHCNQTLVQVDDDEANPHWNVLLPLVQTFHDGKAARVPHWHAQETGALDRLRALWGHRLALELELEVPSVVNCYWQYRKGPEKIRHALRYNARSFPGWSRWTTTVGSNRYGTMANKRIANMRIAVEKSLGLVEKIKNYIRCHCGKESHCQGVTGAMQWSYIAGGVAPPATPHPKAGGA